MAIPLEYDSWDAVDGGLAVLPTTKPSTGPGVSRRALAANSRTESEQVNEFIVVEGEFVLRDGRRKFVL